MSSSRPSTSSQGGVGGGGGGGGSRPQAIDEDSSRSKVKQTRYLSAVVPEGGGGEFCKTYIMKKQGHTLGNTLKFIIEHYPEVKFCGYTQPHPAEDLIHFRLQTRGMDTDTVLKRGFEDLKSLCGIVEDKFKADLARYEVEGPTTFEDSTS